MQIILKKIGYDDLDLIRKWRMQPEVTKYMYTDPIITPEQQVEWYERITNDSTVKYWIINVDKTNIGLLYITKIYSNAKSCECAYYIAEDKFRGIGIANYIEYNLYDYVFNILKLDKLWFEVLSFNIRAIRLHEKFGCIIEKNLEKHICKNNYYYDVFKMSITKSKWETIKQDMEFFYEKIFIEQ